MRKLGLGLLTGVCGSFVLLPNYCTAQQKASVLATPKHWLGHLRSDTLLLSAAYAEHGEFGGHRELIKVYMRREKWMQARNSPDWESFPLTAAWFFDSAQWNQPKRKFILRKQRLIKPEEEATIVQYIQALLTENLKETGMTLSNGGNRYSVKKAPGKDLQVDYYDARHTFGGFDALREKLFRQ